ncbi:MAG: LLM class flavin-dependent oxidoreductase [Proteobacteria bacterium]|nr:LLM class flavin-dependent oxidoreductase [Pseudomonadota bacterium]
MKLSILCQSPISAGMSPAEAVQNTVELAKLADDTGYERFWVAEHHSDVALASGAPEVMVAHIAAKTSRIRVGSGGVLIPYHSPFHIAEQFNLLAALNPDRIDLGIGRSGGSEQHAPQALGVRAAGEQSFAAIDELLSWLGEGHAKRPYADTFASPRIETPAAPWSLGTSVVSARFAAERGLPYVFGGFLDPRGMMPALQAYHQLFQPGWIDKPRVMLAWYVQAAETEAEAQALTRSSEHWFVENLIRGRNAPFPNPADIASAAYGPMEQMAIAMRRQFALVGTADQVLDGLEKLQKQTAADELMLVTIPFEPEARRRSYELLARDR